MAKTETLGSAGRVLEVLDLLFRADFALGLSPGDIARELKLTPSTVTRVLVTLEAAGVAERIPVTDRIRPAVRWAQYAAGILNSLDAAIRRAEELKTRITTPVH
jgi:DNA-binding IclR family transcriptional regulator